jgi:hypothetical protein
MKRLSIILAQTAEALEDVHYPRVSVAWQDKDLIYRRVYNPSPDLGMNILGKRLEDLMTNQAEAQRLTAIKQTVLTTGRPHHESIKIELGGKAHYYDLTVERTEDDSGQPDGLISVNIDVTDLIFAKHQLMKANERLTQMLEDTLDSTGPSTRR